MGYALYEDTIYSNKMFLFFYDYVWTTACIICMHEGQMEPTRQSGGEPEFLLPD